MGDRFSPSSAAKATPASSRRMPANRPACSLCTLGLICGLAILALAGLPSLTAAEDTVAFPQAELLPTDWADGDSFLVRFTEPSSGTLRQEVFRLYGVDCMETRTTLESDRRRLLEQARHFGVENPSRLIAEGQTATKFVQSVLTHPFTVHTGFALAMGRSKKPRYYAFITTSEGADLGELLVAKGLARAKGIIRQRADGTSQEEYAARLVDLELTAAMDRVGIWKLSNSARLAELRAQKRQEDRELSAIRPPETTQPLDINTATQADLEGLPGIGPVLAARILQHRPYQSLDDLEKVKGLSASTREKITPLLKRL